MKNYFLLSSLATLVLLCSNSVIGQDLSKYGIADNKENVLGGLKVGDLAPNFVAKDHLGKEVELKKALANGPVVLVFYRGYWCPVCSKHLSALQEDLATLEEKGAQVLAVSPEKTSYTLKAAEESEIMFSILSDTDGQIMKDYKVFFRTTESYQDKVTKYFDFQLEDTQSTGDANLPVPATYVVGKDGKIKYTFYDPNYGKRAKIKDIMEVL